MVLAIPLYAVEPKPGLLVTPKLRLVKRLGAGGMGAVWLADHLSLKSQVVVKFVSEELAWSSEAADRFAREAAAASQVRSPHVVQILDYGVTEEGLAYIVMELLDGHDLANHLTAGGLPPREVQEIVTQLCRALSLVHEAGFVHRDIKPGNVFLCHVGGGELFVKLLDFGVAKDVRALETGGDQTRSGTLLGSPVYMSPEQLLGSKALDLRSDLWSVGVLTFEALTGGRPFRGDTVGALTMNVHTPSRPKLTHWNPMLPAAVDEWFARACAVEPAARFQSAKELADGLARVLGEASSRAIALEDSRADSIGRRDTLPAPSSPPPNELAGESKPPRAVEGVRPSREPLAMAATGAGIAKAGAARGESSRLTTVLVAASALAIGIIGSRWMEGRNATGATGVTAPTTHVAEEATAPPVAGAALAPLAPTPPPIVDAAAAPAPRPSAPAPKASAPKPKPHVPVIALPAVSSSSAAPSPAASRAAGSDDDIR